METTLSTQTRLASELMIAETKQTFESKLRASLNLIKVNAPLFVSKSSGLNDNLNGVEKPVSFELGGEEHQVVHSLAKWKRWYLGVLEMPVGRGLVTDMRAIRKDEVLTPIHSHFVDQWDWEKVITKDTRTLGTLVKHAEAVFECLRSTDVEIQGETTLPEKAHVIHTEDLLQLYPELTPKEREKAICEKYGAVILLGIGGKLSSGEPHDLRAPDYDDWTTLVEGKPGLNADLLVWDSVRKDSLEISSMGVRVDKISLEKQLEELSATERKALPFHKALLEEKLPFTIGGGIGQSRVAMFVCRKADIKDVQAIF